MNRAHLLVGRSGFGVCTDLVSLAREDFLVGRGAWRWSCQGASRGRRGSRCCAGSGPGRWGAGSPPWPPPPRPTLQHQNTRITSTLHTKITITHKIILFENNFLNQNRVCVCSSDFQKQSSTRLFIFLTRRPSRGFAFSTHTWEFFYFTLCGEICSDELIKRRRVENMFCQRRPRICGASAGGGRRPPSPPFVCDLRETKKVLFSSRNALEASFVFWELDAGLRVRRRRQKSSTIFSLLCVRAGGRRSFALSIFRRMHLFCRSAHLSSLSHTLRVKLQVYLCLRRCNFIYTRAQLSAHRVGCTSEKGNNNWHTSLSRSFLPRLNIIISAHIFSSLRMKQLLKKRRVNDVEMRDQ